MRREQSGLYLTAGSAPRTAGLRFPWGDMAVAAVLAAGTCLLLRELFPSISEQWWLLTLLMLPLCAGLLLLYETKCGPWLLPSGALLLLLLFLAGRTPVLSGFGCLGNDLLSLLTARTGRIYLDFAAADPDRVYWALIPLLVLCALLLSRAVWSGRLWLALPLLLPAYAAMLTGLAPCGVSCGLLTAGTVLLVFDVTERAFAERNRREFTANVSHELKTPLQGIIGSAELLENGLVKQEDVPRFIGHIRSEAQRLVTLIGDIIRLSQLDEGEPMPAEPVELLALAREAAESLQSAAAARNVTVTVEGEPVELTGVRRLLYEIVFNLCDNAIKYNTDDGRVQVTVTKENETAAVTVRDTGIGIPPDQQDRVFERFYRVDKSHSKASGGTGLGLSIVKHAVQYHHGAIHLQSEVGKGTEIRVTFPMA